MNGSHLFDPRYAKAMQARDQDPFLSFGLLQQLRRQYGWDQPDLAPLEHEAFMRSWVNDNPVAAIPAGLLAPAGYYAAKKLGLKDADTPASLEQMAAGYGGYVKGLLDLF